MFQCTASFDCRWWICYTSGNIIVILLVKALVSTILFRTWWLVTGQLTKQNLTFLNGNITSLGNRIEHTAGQNLPHRTIHQGAWDQNCLRLQVGLKLSLKVKPKESRRSLEVKISVCISLSHSVVRRPSTPLRYNPVDILTGILNITCLAMHAVLSVYL